MKLFGPGSWVHAALFWSGAACCLLGGALVLLATRAPPHSSDAASLLVAGLALLCGGSGVCVLGWRQRRQWVRLDADSLSRPWAAGKPSLPLQGLSSVQESSWGGVVVSSTAGAHLRIAGDLPEFRQLLEQLCDRIADNGYPVTATVWQDARGSEGHATIAVTPREVSAHWTGQEHPSKVGWSEITELWLTRDAQRRLVAAIALEDGRALCFPHIGKTKTLDIYRALRQTLRQRNPAALAGQRHGLRERRAAENTRRAALGIVLIAGLCGGVLGAQRGCHPSEQR